MGRCALALLATLLAGCAELTAEAPLFSADGPNGPPPLTEGVWIGVSEECPASNARRTGRFPEACTPLDIRREADGAWRVQLRVDLIYDLTAAERADAAADAVPFRLVIAPATERDLADSYAPLYIAEGRRAGADDPEVSYALIAPIGAMPATSAYILGSIGCADILRDGPIVGITPRYTVRTNNEQPANSEGPQDIGPIETEQVLSGCTATTQAAVREAARRALIENLGEMQETRYVFVRAQ